MYVNTYILSHLRREMLQGDVPMKAIEGEIYKNLMNGGEYRVKKIIKNMVVLESQDGKAQILTEIGTLGIEALYQKKESGE